MSDEISSSQVKIPNLENEIYLKNIGPRNKKLKKLKFWFISNLLIAYFAKGCLNPSEMIRELQSLKFLGSYQHFWGAISLILFESSQCIRDGIFRMLSAVADAFQNASNFKRILEIPPQFCNGHFSNITSQLSARVT